MKTVNDNENVDVRAASASYQMALWSAIAGGVFSAVVLVFLVVNYVQIKVLDPIRAERLELMKVKLIGQPSSAELLPQIRQLDMDIRADRIRRLVFSRRGGYLLLGGLVVFVAGLKWTVVANRKLPMPEAVGDKQALQVRQACMARWTVAAGLGLFGIAALVIALRPQIDLAGDAAKIRPYPSIEEIGNNWAGFRGPEGSGISAYTNIPDKWNGKTGEGIIWKTKVPINSYNSPVVWEGRVFLSGAKKTKRQVYCFDAVGGQLLWTGDVSGSVGSSPATVSVSTDTGFAASTVVTDGRRVYAVFANGDIASFDFDGNHIWTRNLGSPDSSYGYASSLAMYQNLVLVQYDQGMLEDAKSRMIALDGFSGLVVWEVKRPVSASWTSPIVAKVGDGHQLITRGEPWVIGYDPASGAELWRAECDGTDVAPSPVYAGGLVFAVSPYNELFAVKADGQGDVTKTHIAWVGEDGIPDICSPVSNGEQVFLLTTSGTLTCYSLADGQMLWEEDLDANFMASPSLVGNRMYLLSEKGVMLIAEVGAAYKELARCELGDKTQACPAFADGRIYIRGRKNLYCIGNAN
ncbi:MAG: PQQ-binding-like beta-propeller repeat protein [Planctomycetota bacterium]